MMICPVCGKQWETGGLCPDCGWDASADAELRPTLFSSAGSPSRAVRAERLRAAAAEAEAEKLYAALGRLLFAGLEPERLLACLEAEDPAGAAMELIILNRKARKSGVLRSRAFAGEEDLRAAERICFRSSLQGLPGDARDLSGNGGGSVMGFLRAEPEGLTLNICGEGGVQAPADCGELFKEFKVLRAIDFGGCFHTEEVTDMQSMFYGCEALTELDLSAFDTSGVTDMLAMFANCSALRKLDLSSFDTSGVVNMRSMFYGCKKLRPLDLRSFRTPRLTNMTAMFYSCETLTELDLSSFDTSGVTGMRSLFYGCRSLRALELGGFDTARVTDMTGMFYRCSGLETLDLSSFDTAQVKGMSFMFDGCASLKALDVSRFRTGQARDMSYMFRDCCALESLDLRGFTIAPECRTNDMVKGVPRVLGSRPAPGAGGVKKAEPRRGGRLRAGAFSDKNTFGRTEVIRFRDTLNDLPKNSMDLSQEGDGSVMAYFRPEDGKLTLNVCGEGGVRAPANSAELFKDLDQLRSIYFNGCFHTGDAVDMRNMFSGCRKLLTLDLRSFDTVRVTSMNGMFFDCRALLSLDVSSFNTARVKDMSFMFDGCGELEYLDLSSFRTGQVTSMIFMFSRCSSLRTLNVRSFDTSRVTETHSMFFGCSALESLDVSSFDTARVGDMGSMFARCRSLKELDIRHFVIAPGCRTDDMTAGVPKVMGPGEAG